MTRLLSLVGLLGDIHAEDRLLEQALGVFRETGVTDVLCVGDVVDGEGDPNRCFDLLQDHGVICVAGNHERWMLSNDIS